jgi:hypothetical protein
MPHPNPAYIRELIAISESPQISGTIGQHFLFIPIPRKTILFPAPGSKGD